MARRPYRQLFETLILNVLDNVIPMNVEAIRRGVSEKLGREVSWNTIKKYLESLRDDGSVEEIHTGKLLLYKRK